MSKVRVCFLGTPEFAVTCLKALLEDDHYEVVGVVTQPDRPAGRKLVLTPSAVKSFAVSKGLRIISPESLKNQASILQEIQKWGAEVAVVVAFGQILTDEFLRSFPLGAVNVHGSLLPRWRGAAPIQRAIEAGDSETGVCLQKIVKKLDAGDLLGSRKVRIDDSITAMEMYGKLAQLGADLLKVELMDYVRGNLAPIPQDEAQVTYAKKIEKTESHIPWNLTARQIHNRVRAFTMGPGSYFMWQGKRVKVHRTEVIEPDFKGTSGVVAKAENDELLIETHQGKLRICELQTESKSRMSIKDFLAGQSLKKGDLLQ